jgi:hypothetical protein
MLKNLSLRFDPVEDRLLLRLHLIGAGGLESVHALHLTRRLCAAWRGDLQAMIDASAQTPPHLGEGAKAAVSKAHHQAMSAQAVARTEPAPAAAEPVDTTPQLVTAIACGRRVSDSRWIVRFTLKNQTNIGLVLTGQTLHALVDALSRRVQVAQWALNPIAVESKDPTPPILAKEFH